MNVNKVILVGRITNEPELKPIPTGVNVCNFSIATNEYYMKDNVRQEKTEFHSIVVFGKQAENIAQYMSKGSEIYIEGKLQTRSWEDEATKKKMYKTEIIALNTQFGAKPNTESKPKTVQKQADDSIDYPDEDINPEDIPF